MANLAEILDQENVSVEQGLEAFLERSLDLGFELYPAQEQAILEIMDEKHIVLSTPTGSGKSLVATAMLFRALLEGQKAFYTCPIKALVSEKFFALCDEFGPGRVGMMTGDGSVNPEAQIIVCTAEILSNQCLRQEDFEPYAVVMDEFHYYSDRDRGQAWQIPLLLCKKTRFLLMSATLGDISTIVSSLESNSKRKLSVVRGSQRPVPLEFKYSEKPLHESLDEVCKSGIAPVYVVNFTQREAADRAQAFLSSDFITKEEKQAIAKSIAKFRFDSPFGQKISRWLRHGVGLHHAGLLPKYRLLTEQLAQGGHLKVISGTDTLGVGVNVPIRTVLFTGLSKYDGEKVGILSVRDFHQIAGRAGRKGFDTQGTVIAQAPEHVIENIRIDRKIAADPKKKKKLPKKKPPQGFVSWNEEKFLDLQNSPAEALVSRFKVDHAMLLNLMQRAPDDGAIGYRKLIELIELSHETPRRRAEHRRHTARIFRSLRSTNILAIDRKQGGRPRVIINTLLQQDFSLNHGLSLFLVEILKQLPDDEFYALNVVSLCESILENPRAILRAQLNQKKNELVASMKAEGRDYDERMEALEEVEIDKPMGDFVYAHFGDFREVHPWMSQENIKPKSIVREMLEGAMNFNDYVKAYRIETSEGALLRYLSQAYKTISQNVPDEMKDETLFEYQAYLRAVLGRADSSLITEWETMVAGDDASHDIVELQTKTRPFPDRRSRLMRCRAEIHPLLRALAHRDFESFWTALHGDDQELQSARDIERLMKPYFESYPSLIYQGQARLSDKTQIIEVQKDEWTIRQTLVDPEGDLAWYLEMSVDWNSLQNPDDVALRFVTITE